MQNMNDLINTLKEVPAMPNVIVHALNIMKDPESGAKKLASIISYDQSLSTKVLTLVNSAYYGFPQQITSIQRAIALIGMAKAKNIIVTVAMRPMLMSHGDKELWKHSIKTAVGCEYLAKHLKVIDPDEAFVMGFLHDLGKMVLNLKDSRLYEKVTEMAKEGSDLLELEKSFFGIDHCQTGGLLAKRWQLPLLIANTIKYHYNPNLSSMPKAAAVVYLVDKLVQEGENYGDINNDYIKSLDIKIDQPQIMRETILSKAEILLNELST